MRKALIGLLMGVGVLSGCASVAMVDPQRDAAAKTFVAPADKAGLYVYRNELIGSAVKMDVAIDGKDVGQTVAKTYLYKEVAPGKHVTVPLPRSTLCILWTGLPNGQQSWSLALDYCTANFSGGTLCTFAAAPFVQKRWSAADRWRLAGRSERRRRGGPHQRWERLQ